MANTIIQLKRSSVAGKQPNTSTLSIGELALNMADGILYSSNGSAIIEIGANNTTQRITNSLNLDNNKPITFKTVNTAASVSFIQQNDDNFVFYTTNSTYGQRAVWSIFANNNTANLKIATQTTFNGNVDLNIVAVYANGSPGTSGQVLTTNGTSTYWSTIAGGGGSVNTSAQYTWTNTHTFSANVTFTGNGIGISTNTGAIYLGGIADANWKIGRNTGVVTKWKYTNNTIDIVTANSNLEGMAIGLVGGNSYFETGYLGTFVAANLTIGNTSSNSTINSTAFSGSANNTSFLGGTAAASYQLNSTLSANVATLSSNNATFINGNNVLTVMESLRANRALHGGGTITVDGSGNILWSARYIVISNGRGTHFSTEGFFNISCPTSGTITGVGGAANKTATAAGIPLAAWEALYYILPIGSNSGSLAANFRVVNYTSDVEIPSNWLLICAQNSDNGNYYFNNGVILKAGQSYVGGSHTSTTIGSNTFTVGTGTYFVAGGNVGIGNTTPNAKLQVTGTANVSGNVDIGGITTFSGNVVLGSSGVSSNGSFGTAGHVLHSNGTATYWAADDNSGGTVTSIATGNGMTGGTITTTGTVSVLANTGIVANATGLYVNATYIGTISSNNATYLNGQLASYYTNATNITTGTLPYAQIPTNVVNTTASFTISGVYTYSANIVISSGSVLAKTDIEDRYISNTTASTLQTAIDSFSATTYRSAKYIIQVTNGTSYHYTEVAIVHDGTTAYATEFATMFTGASLVSFAVDINTGNVRLLATAANATTTTYKIDRKLIKV